MGEAQKASRQIADKKQFSGFRLLGLGFWQAWWMIAMCSSTLLPNENHYSAIGSTTLWVLVLTTLGYVAIVLAAKRLSPFSSYKQSFLLAGGLTAAGSLLLPFSLTVLNGPLGIGIFLASAIIVSIGNALLLIMWGELWSALASGRVGRHLYFSYSFAFVLFFIAYFLPSPLDAIFTGCLPIVSAFILYSCKNEPRRPAVVTPLDIKSVPFKRIFASILTISIIYGFSQGIVGTFTQNTQDDFLAQVLLFTGAAIVAVMLKMVIAPAESESVALYRPVIPAMIAGFVALLVLPINYSFIGAGLVIMGVYCLDMLIMLVSTDVAFRARIPIALSFGLSILVARTGTLLGSFAAHGFVNDLTWTAQMRADVLLVSVLILVFVGMIFFTQSDIQKLYQQQRVSANQHSLQKNCETIAQMCNLTARETEVLILLARGKTVKGVCEELTIAQGTAKHHVSNIYRKVGVYDRQSLHAIVEQGGVGKDSLSSL